MNFSGFELFLDDRIVSIADNIHVRRGAGRPIRPFHRGEVGGGGIEVTFVPGADQCEQFDAYGPTGHPPVAERDYSAARQKPALRPDD